MDDRPLSGKPAISPLVTSMLLIIAMPMAVDLDHKLRGGAVEVADIDP